MIDYTTKTSQCIGQLHIVMFQKVLTHAQEIIKKRISEKCEKGITFQDYQEHTDYDAYSDYNDCHGDYYDLEYQ